MKNYAKAKKKLQTKANALKAGGAGPVIGTTDYKQLKTQKKMKFWGF